MINIPTIIIILISAFLVGFGIVRWLDIQLILWRSRRNRRKSAISRHEVDKAMRDLNKSEQDLKYYIKQEQEYIDSKKGGGNV